MSMYFDGAIACDLKPDTPQQVLDVLQYMTRKEDYAFDSVPSHSFFTTNEEWRDFLQIDQEWTCAPGLVGSDFRKTFRYTKNSEDVYRWTLSFRRTMHDDYEFPDFWWEFLFWIAPYSESTGFVGYYREEFELNPTLIYFQSGKVFTSEVTQSPAGSNGEEWDYSVRWTE